MAQIGRDRLAAVIHTWRDGARLFEGTAGAAPDEAVLVRALLVRLQRHTTMLGLVEAYLDDAGWPSDLPWPASVDRRCRQLAVVGTAYWRRHQELLAQATEGRVEPPAAAAPEPTTPGDLGPEFGHLELLYTIKLWQRGPLRLRALPADRRARYEPLVETIHARVASCEDARALAARYYGDGQWILRFAREALAPLGEPISNVGWIQDAACWQRYQELVEASPARQRPTVRPAEFAIWLANQMTRRRVSVAELACRLGTIEGVVRSWLHAGDVPSEESVRRLAGALGLSESQMPKVGGAA